MDLATQRKRVQKGLVALRHPVYRGALRRKVLAAVEHEPVVAGLGPVGTVLDVGANVGQFALVARKVFPAARILSFEPFPAAAARLGEVFAGDPSFELVPLALSDEAGRHTFHVAAAEDSSSLLPIGDRQVAEFAHTRSVGAIEVDVARLDDVLADRPPLAGPVLLKLDTQGTELAVLRGADKSLGQVDHVILEASFVELYVGQARATELVAHLLDRGFQLGAVYDVKTSIHTGEPLQADFVFSRRSGGAVQ
jgi:FkbM family methyltransferase